MSLDRIRPLSARADSPLTAAVRAARWIRSAALDDELGRRWLANPDPRGASAVTPEPWSLYSGSAGIVLFFLELAAATGEESYLEDARAGARRLAATWREQDDLSLYHGLTGTMLALMEAGWALGEGGFESEAAAIADEIVRRGDPARSPHDGGWPRDPAQRGEGGIVLGLLRAAAHLGLPGYEAAAVEAGLRIARLPVPGHRFGDCADLPVDAVTPGFLAGTAGTAFLLARLYGVTGDERFLFAARSGAAFVREVSVVTEGCAVVPHHVPHARSLHYLGFCSGSAGVARMFYELYRVTGDPGDLEWVERLARGIVRSGVPNRRTEGYWNVACQCCGAAGLIELFVGLWAATGQESHLECARTLAADLLGRATDHDGRGYRWYQAYRRLRPGEVTADTGYMVGAAGIGAALLHLDAAGRADRARRVILLPDNPFPAIPVPRSVLGGGVSE
ncbi:lanthionine synthetase LanC family protein [Nonomuraea jiangxiensis]|uniref:Lanthionine synthetase C-like protein n=1 Tax=Nonomuraea jiangxiensis TaxID=633440 RepID=A0A1G7ZBY3_9ACTN|nr:lanthionine synthetase LanC family protein [Nonomuraea jiangxiensis]SDH06097.1 Lanthionine synthetase C-like protein [Nonomuraea jiangxiensis]